MTRRTVPALLAAGLAAAALSGCGTPRAGAAAVVGADRISTTALQAMVARGLSDPQAQQTVGQDRVKFQRDTLNRLVTHDLLVAAAADRRVTVSEGAVDARLAGFAQQAGGQAALEQQAAQSGIARQDVRGFVHDFVLNDALADSVTASLQPDPAQVAALYQQNIANYDQVHAAHILVATAQQAQAVLAQVTANPGSFAALAARYSTDASNKAKGGDLPFAGRGSFVKPFEDAVFAARPGTFLLVHTQFGYHVVHVIERRTTTLAQAAPELRRQALAAQRSAGVKDLLRRTARRVGVEVNPRFGTWDPATAAVVAPGYDPTKDVTSPAPQPAVSPAAPVVPPAG